MLSIMLDQLVTAVEAALGDDRITTDHERAEAMRPAMAALLMAEGEPIPPWAEEPYKGSAVGNLLHADPEGRFHVLAVVFPEGTSSGVHFHGCWGVIGYLRGGDEETRYAPGEDGIPQEVSRHVWRQGDITYLLPEDGAGSLAAAAGSGDTVERSGCWHRVRNPGPGTGVSVHVLCRTPAEHPHKYFDRDSNTILDFPFVEAAPGRWIAQVAR